MKAVAAGSPVRSGSAWVVKVFERGTASAGGAAGGAGDATIIVTADGTSYAFRRSRRGESGEWGESSRARAAPPRKAVPARVVRARATRADKPGFAAPPDAVWNALRFITGPGRGPDLPFFTVEFLEVKPPSGKRRAYFNVLVRCERFGGDYWFRYSVDADGRVLNVTPAM